MLRDIGGYVECAKQAVAQGLTIFTIFFLPYMNTKSTVKAGIVMLAVPFSMVGAVWLMNFLDYNVSIAAWVGMIALMGLDAETGVFMLLFLDLSYEEAKAKGRLRSMAELHEAIIHGAVMRVRPKMMTAAIGPKPRRCTRWCGTTRRPCPGAIDDGALAVRIPKHARKELLAYLDCGLLCRGFARLRCRPCAETRLVAFSCKGRGFCPSCMGRRMSATAANLIERVLPPSTPLRQWVRGRRGQGAHTDPRTTAREPHAHAGGVGPAAGPIPRE